MAITRQSLESSFQKFNGNDKKFYDGETDTYHTFDEILIIGGGIRKWFSGFAPDSMLGFDEVLWASNPSRSSVAPFSFTNIDILEFYSVAQLQVNFPIISYDDFIELQTILHQRYVTITFFNLYTSEWQTREMAITGNERGAIYNRGTSIGGVKGVKVKFVATNRGLVEFDEGVTIEYYNRNGSLLVTEKYDVGSQVRIKTPTEIEVTSVSRPFLYWSTDQTLSFVTRTYYANQYTTIFEKVVKLYPQFEQ